MSDRREDACKGSPEVSVPEEARSQDIRCGWSSDTETGAPPPCDETKSHASGKSGRAVPRRVTDFTRRSPLSATGAIEVYDDHVERDSWSLFRHRVFAVINSKVADLIIGALVLVQVGLVVFETNERAAQNTAPAWMRPVSVCILFCYVTDVALRWFVFRMQYFTNGSNVWDMLVVISDLLCEVMTISGIDVVSINTVASILRTLRILRLVRVATSYGVFVELDMMLSGIIDSVKAVFWGVLLLGLVLTVFSLIAVDLIHPLNKDIAQTGVYEGCHFCAEAFDSVYQSNLTFVQMLIIGDSWNLVVGRIMKEHPWTALVFLSNLFCIQFGVLNLILMVIVDLAARARERDVQMHLMLKRQAYKTSKDDLRRICQKLDLDRSGFLTKEELVEGFYTVPEFAKAMEVMDICAHDLDFVFGVLDRDSSGTVEYEEFVEELYKMKVQDPHTLMVFNRFVLCDINERLAEAVTDTNARFQAIDTVLLSVSKVLGVVDAQVADPRPSLSAEYAVATNTEDLAADLTAHPTASAVGGGKIDEQATSSAAPAPAGASGGGGGGAAAARCGEPSLPGGILARALRGKNKAYSAHQVAPTSRQATTQDYRHVAKGVVDEERLDSFAKALDHFCRVARPAWRRLDEEMSATAQNLLKDLSVSDQRAFPNKRLGEIGVEAAEDPAILSVTPCHPHIPLLV